MFGSIRNYCERHKFKVLIFGSMIFLVILSILRKFILPITGHPLFLDFILIVIFGVFFVSIMRFATAGPVNETDLDRERVQHEHECYCHNERDCHGRYERLNSQFLLLLGCLFVLLTAINARFFEPVPNN